MSLIKCAGFITSMSADKGMGNTDKKTASKLGRILYGCDICQDVCPFNEGKHRGGVDFPGLSEIVQYMQPEKIMSMDYEEISRVLSKYWYISKDNLWKWKLNALTYMMNNYNDSYKEYIKLGASDTDKRVRRFAAKVIKGVR